MSCIIETFEIRKKLGEIFVERLGFTSDFMEEKDLDEHLLGYEFNLDHRQMIYLFYDVERVFDIKIPEKDIISRRFGTFNNIVDIIYEQINGTFIESY